MPAIYTKKTPDSILILACQKGDQEAWSFLVERYQRLVYTIARRYGLNESESNDVFQTVWLILLQNINNLDQPDRISAWLVTTTKRECWDQRRGADYKQTDNYDIEENDWASQEEPVEEIVSQFSESEQLRSALAQLDERCRKLLTLLYFNATKPSYNEISAAFDIAIGAIGPTRARCLKKLKEFF